MILLYSGGADSFIAWHYLNKPKTLYFKIGHRYERFELEAIQKTIPNTILEDCLKLGKWEEPDANIPMRNAFFFMLASYYDNQICLVVQQGEMKIPDRSPEFFESFGSKLSFLHEKGKRIFSPFYHMTKTEMVKWYLDQGLSKEDLLKTRSCFSSFDKPCGKCNACFRRWVSFSLNGIEELMTNDIREYKEIPNYIEKMKRGIYDEIRTEETFRALRMAGISI